MSYVLYLNIYEIKYYKMFYILIKIIKYKIKSLYFKYLSIEIKHFVPY